MARAKDSAVRVKGVERGRLFSLIAKSIEVFLHAALISSLFFKY